MKTGCKVLGVFLAFALALACGESTAQSYAPSGNVSLVRPNANAKARSSNACLAGDKDPMKLVRELLERLMSSSQ